MQDSSSFIMLPIRTRSAWSSNVTQENIQSVYCVVWQTRFYAPEGVYWEIVPNIRNTSSRRPRRMYFPIYPACRKCTDTLSNGHWPCCVVKALSNSLCLLSFVIVAHRLGYSWWDPSLRSSSYIQRWLSFLVITSKNIWKSRLFAAPRLFKMAYLNY